MRRGRRSSLWQRGRKALPEPNRWRGSRERGGRRTRLREKLCGSIYFLLFSGCEVFQAGRNLLHGRGRGFSFSFRRVRLHFHCFCDAAVPCRAFSFVHPSTDIPGTAYQKKEISTLPRVCTYVRHVSERSGRNRPRRKAYVASELFIPEAWRRGTLAIIESPVCNYNHDKKTIFNHGPLSASHKLMYFSFLSEAPCMSYSVPRTLVCSYLIPGGTIVWYGTSTQLLCITAVVAIAAAGTKKHESSDVIFPSPHQNGSRSRSIPA